jgi:arsenite methyltransferase
MNGGELETDRLREVVRNAYARVATAAPQAAGCCGPAPSSTTACCGGAGINPVSAERLGYSAEDLASLPEGADMGLGCGNPLAIAALRRGEVVVDLGAGGGFDCFLAARRVGPEGRVIGIDMTPEMVAKARANAVKGGFGNVEFRLGEIEHLPLAVGVADVVISNCVINLSPDKAQVFREAFRVLKPGGRLAISDVVATAPLPAEIRQDAALIAGCMGNAAEIGDIEAMLGAAGFVAVSIRPKDESKSFIRDWAPGRNVTDFLIAALIEAVKPAA